MSPELLFKSERVHTSEGEQFSTTTRHRPDPVRVAVSSVSSSSSLLGPAAVRRRGGLGHRAIQLRPICQLSPRNSAGLVGLPHFW